MAPIGSTRFTFGQFPSRRSECLARVAARLLRSSRAAGPARSLILIRQHCTVAAFARTQVLQGCRTIANSVHTDGIRSDRIMVLSKPFRGRVEKRKRR